MRSKAQPKVPQALAVGMLEDGDRALFLVRLGGKGEERLEMPCADVMQGENPVAAIASAFRAMTGIDAQVHEIAFQKRHNAGTRKKRIVVPALIFRLSAKSHAVRHSPEFAGYRWLEISDLKGMLLSRKSEWLRTG